MKKIIFLILCAFAVNSYASTLITLNCESDIGFTLMDDFSRGTVSLASGNDDVQIISMRQTAVSESHTEFEASLYMSKANIKISKPKALAGFKVYNVTVDIFSEERTKSKKLECSSL